MTNNNLKNSTIEEACNLSISCINQLDNEIQQRYEEICGLVEEMFKSKSIKNSHSKDFYKDIFPENTFKTLEESYKKLSNILTKGGFSEETSKKLAISELNLFIYASARHEIQYQNNLFRSVLNRFIGEDKNV